MTVVESKFDDPIVPLHGWRWVIELHDGKQWHLVIAGGTVSYKSQGGARRNANRLLRACFAETGALRLRGSARGQTKLVFL